MFVETNAATATPSSPMTSTWLGQSRLPIVGEHRAQRDVLEPARLAHAVAQDPLSYEAVLAQHGARGVAAHQVHRVDPVQPELAEAEAQHRPRGLGREPVAPLGLGDPEPQLRAAVRVVERAQLDSAEQAGAVALLDREVDRAARLI